MAPVLAACGHGSVALAKPHLCLPGDVQNLLGESMVAFRDMVTDAGGHSVSPGSFDSTRRPRSVPALVIDPQMVFSPEECSEGDSPT